jgi:hypothetical protein
MPYMQKIAGEVEARAKEAELVAKGGDVDLEGVRATEIVWLVSDGPQDLRSLMWLTELETPVLKRYLRALRAAGKVKVWTDRTGPRARQMIQAVG